VSPAQRRPPPRLDRTPDCRGLACSQQSTPPMALDALGKPELCRAELFVSSAANPSPDCEASREKQNPAEAGLCCPAAAEAIDRISSRRARQRKKPRRSGACLALAEQKPRNEASGRGARAQTVHTKYGEPAQRSDEASVAVYMSMSPMPPMPPIPPPPPIGLSSFGASATIASVVRMRPATDAAFCSAKRVTLVGSSTPISTMSP